MLHKMEVEKQDAHLLVSFRGQVSSEHLLRNRNWFTDVATVCRWHGQGRVFIDLRGAVIKLSFAGEVKTALDLAKWRDVITRLVLGTLRDHFSSDCPFQMAAEREGLAVSVFTDRGRAESWLLGQDE